MDFLNISGYVSEDSELLSREVNDYIFALNYAADDHRHDSSHINLSIRDIIFSLRFLVDMTSNGSFHIISVSGHFQCEQIKKLLVY